MKLAPPKDTVRVAEVVVLDDAEGRDEVVDVVAPGDVVGVVDDVAPGDVRDVVDVVDVGLNPEGVVEVEVVVDVVVWAQPG